MQEPYDHDRRVWLTGPRARAPLYYFNRRRDMGLRRHAAPLMLVALASLALGAVGLWRTWADWVIWLCIGAGGVSALGSWLYFTLDWR